LIYIVKFYRLCDCENTIHTLIKESWSVFPNPFQNTLKIKHKNLSPSNVKIKKYFWSILWNIINKSIPWFKSFG